MSNTAYPLSWPTGYKRTPASQRTRAAFGRVRADSPRRERLGMVDALDRLFGELRRLCADKIVLSTDVEVRLDGLPYANRRAPSDPGAAVYFTLKSKPTAMACDKWDRVEDNIAALAAHIECLRGIDRYGIGTLEQAFAGYAALPPPDNFTWKTMLGFQPDESVTLEAAEAAFRRLANEHHPDRGGSTEQMMQINAAIAAARKELKAVS